MNFRKFLEQAAKKVNQQVAEIFKEQLEEAKKTDQKLVSLLRIFIRSGEGGKGIRGALVVLGYQIVSQAINKDIFQIAAAYEIFQNAILIHDDIIDQSVIRRNKPALYKALGKGHYGISQAISLADYGFFLSFKIISESNFPPERKISALKLYSRVVMDTTWGEMLDLEKTNPLTIATLKTARYTIVGPLQVGAILGGADDKLIRVLGNFGEGLGIAFQIQDDILDGDVKSIEKAKEQAKEYSDKAMKVLPSITKDPKLSKILEQMVNYLIERTK